MTPEDELRQLRERVQELEAKRSEAPRAEIVREAVDAHVEQGIPVPTPEYHAESNQSKPTRHAELYQKDGIEIDREHREQIEKLLQEVTTEGLVKTVKKVRAANDIHIIDDFHDALVQYLQTRHGV